MIVPVEMVRCKIQQNAHIRPKSLNMVELKTAYFQQCIGVWGSRFHNSGKCRSHIARHHRLSARQVPGVVKPFYYSCFPVAPCNSNDRGGGTTAVPFNL